MQRQQIRIGSNDHICSTIQRNFQKLVVLGITALAQRPRIQSLSREHGLTAYDAAYLDLAKTNDLPLATLDQDLIRACGKVVIELV